MRRKGLVALVAATFGLLAACGEGGSGETSEDDFPSKPMTFLIPYDAGGGSDVTARLVGRLMEEELDATITPVNVPGGSGAVGLAQLHKKEPDGYTFMVITSSLSALKPLGTSPFGSEDFDVVATIQAEPYGLGVPADSPYETIEDFLAAAEDTRLNVGTTAVGGNNFLAATVALKETGADVELVPYEGGAAQAVVDTAGGVLDATFASPTEFRAQMEAKNLRLLALTSEERLEAMPDVPTFSELGHDVVFETVRVILVPKGTPPERIDILEEALKSAVENPEFEEAMVSGGSAPRFLNSEDTRAAVQEQDKVYLELLKETGLVE